MLTRQVTPVLELIGACTGRVAAVEKIQGASVQCMEPKRVSNYISRNDTEKQDKRSSLKTLDSLNKESRPFYLGDNSIWSFPSVSLPLAHYSISRF